MDRRFLVSVAVASAVMPRRVRAGPVAPPMLRRLSLANAHTGETFAGAYRDDNGPIPRVMDELAVFLRDFHSGAKISIDVGVVDFLANVMDAVGATRATVLSAYRTPETNRMLARTTFGVAENSQHLFGRALDVCLPSRLEDAMQAARAMKRGGVGWYPRSGFFHIDTGPPRNWALTDRGLGNLLLEGKPSEFFRDPVTISAKGELLVGRPGHPRTPADRLSIHRLLARAQRLAIGQ